MSSICGIYSKVNSSAVGEKSTADSNTILKDCVDDMLTTLNHWDADKIGYWLQKNIGLGHLLRVNTPESAREIQPLVCNQSELVICADARLDNRESLCEKLSIRPSQKNKLTDPEIILKAFQHWGKDCASKLLGDFAFVIWDNKRQQLYCARDQVGCKSLFYYQDDIHFVFSSEVKSIKELSIVKTDVDDNWLAHALCLLKPDKESTFYRDIKSLAPAHYLTVGNGHCTIKRYWKLELERETYFADENDYLEAFQEKLEQAVSCRIRSAYPVGSELSGGLDSSYVTALAAPLVNNNLHTFSHVQSLEEKKKFFPFEDESSYIRLICDALALPESQRHMITHHGQGATPAIDRVNRLHGCPALSTQTLYGDDLFRTASNKNVRTLLTGLGGDHLVSSYGLGYREQLFSEKKWKLLWQELPNYNFGHRVAVFISLFLKQKLPAAFNLLQTIKGNPTPQNSWKIFREKLCIDHHYAERKNMPKNFGQASLYPFNGSVRAIEAHQISSPLLVNRLENAGLYASSYGVEYRHPLLDVRLIEFCLSLPANQKQRNGTRRYLFREAMKGKVPKEIQRREDKARHSIPTAISQFNHDLPWLLEQFETLAKQVKKSPYIDIQKVLYHLKNFECDSQPKIPLRAIVFYYMVLNHFSKDSK